MARRRGVPCTDGEGDGEPDDGDCRRRARTLARADHAASVTAGMLRGLGRPSRGTAPPA